MKSRSLQTVLVFVFGMLATWAFNKNVNFLGLVFLYLSGIAFGTVISGGPKS
jgi:hypothetical protein